VDEKFLEIYTDGACKGNPGPGGWGAILLWGDNVKEVSGFESVTTNNRMELMAAIEGLKQVTKSVKIKLYTDSQYLKKGMTEWISLWQHTNWNKGKVKNKDLWEELIELNKKFEIQWCWVKGHNGNKYNERADELACKAVQKYGH
jgi:ribonuclease HI